MKDSKPKIILQRNGRNYKEYNERDKNGKFPNFNNQKKIANKVGLNPPRKQGYEAIFPQIFPKTCFKQL